MTNTQLDIAIELEKKRIHMEKNLHIVSGVDKLIMKKFYKSLCKTILKMMDEFSQKELNIFIDKRKNL